MAKSVERVFRVASGISKSGNTISLASGVAGSGLTYTTGTLSIGSGAITSIMISDGTIVNADINASAAIALSKLATDPLARANHTGTQTASTISDFDTQVRTSRLDQMAAPTSAVSMGSQRITNIATPANSSDGATKGYVDGYVTTQISGASTRAFSTFLA